MLDQEVQDFIDINHLSVSKSRLRDYWIKQAFAEGSTRLSLGRIDFLFGILLVDSQMQKSEIFGRRVADKKISVLIDRFEDFIEERLVVEDFDRTLTSDVLKFFEISEIDQFIYDAARSEEFVNQILSSYLSFFDLDGISLPERKFLTQFTIDRWLEEHDILSPRLQ